MSGVPPMVADPPVPGMVRQKWPPVLTGSTTVCTPQVSATSDSLMSSRIASPLAVTERITTN